MIRRTWCGTVYAASQSTCTSCGGPLPPPPGDDPGPPPPAAPRRLPSQYVRRIRYTRNVSLMLGVVFVPISFVLLFALGIAGIASGQILLLLLGLVFGAVFGGIGVVLGLSGHRKAVTILSAFEHGRATIGRIMDVHLDTSVRINGRSPWAIEYGFQADGIAVSGKAQIWDSSARDRRAGQSLHVLYVEQDPRRNTIYPPVG